MVETWSLQDKTERGRDFLPSRESFPRIHNCLICKQTLIYLEVLLSPLELCQPRDVTVSKQNAAGAIAELLLRAVMDEHSRTGNPNAASRDTLSLPIKLLWYAEEKKKREKKPSRNPDSNVTHVHLFSISASECSSSCLGTRCMCLLRLWFDMVGKKNFSQIIVNIVFPLVLILILQ